MKNSLIKIVRIGLRLHSLFHLLEFLSALYEKAFITASIAFIVMFIELLASFLLPKEHIQIKPSISDIHESCTKE